MTAVDGVRLDRSLPWHVLLIGGASGTGKTRAALKLSRRHGTVVTELDDICLAVERMTTPQQLPALHYWPTHPQAREWPAERILELHLATARELAPAFQTVLEDHLDDGTPAVLEGDYLLPSLLTTATLAHAVDKGRLAAVFLHEPDERQLSANLEAREPGADHSKRARVSWLYGRWLAREAERVGLPAVPVRPWDTQLERILQAVRDATAPRQGSVGRSRDREEA